MLLFDEIESVEFLRQGGGMLAASAKTFDLSIRMQGDQVGVADYSIFLLSTLHAQFTSFLCTQCTFVLTVDVMTFGWSLL